MGKHEMFVPICDGLNAASRATNRLHSEFGRQLKGQGQRIINHLFVKSRMKAEQDSTAPAHAPTPLNSTTQAPTLFSTRRSPGAGSAVGGLVRHTMGGGSQQKEEPKHSSILAIPHRLVTM